MSRPTQLAVTLGCLALVLVVICGGLLVIIKLARPDALMQLPILSTTCTVGMVNTNATITFTGVGADKACDSVVSEDSRLYRSWTKRTEPIVCQGNYRGIGFVVRDQGVFKTVGNELCAMVNSIR